MAGRELYPEEVPRKRAKKDNKDDIGTGIGESIINCIGLSLAEEQPRLFEVRSGTRKEGLEGTNISLLEKNAITVIERLCDEREIDKKGAI